MKKGKSQTRELAMFIVILAVFITIFISMLLVSLISNKTNANLLKTELTIGNALPIINEVEIHGNLTIDLIESEKTLINCTGIIIDYNGENDIVNVTGTFFSWPSYSGASPDDNNSHYSNNSCLIDTSYGDLNEAEAICGFYVNYYAYNGTWFCELTVTDTNNTKDIKNGTNDINDLIAISVPPTIHYGTVDVYSVSEENETNITNVGNAYIDISLDGYGAHDGDGNAMNCTDGTIKNISLEYEKYNISTSHNGSLSADDFLLNNDNYTNLTDSPVTWTDFNLKFREEDLASGIDDFNATYWRIYIPLGVAGNCSGFAVFAASVST